MTLKCDGSHSFCAQTCLPRGYLKENQILIVQGKINSNLSPGINYTIGSAVFKPHFKICTLADRSIARGKMVQNYRVKYARGPVFGIISIV